MTRFLDALREQRWDDHRYYHHSRINQSLHLLSALTFLASYALLFIQPAIAALLGWIVAMLIRQLGHFFFEPRGWDAANAVSHEFKESVKIGYNLRRKVVLLSIWLTTTLVVWFFPAAIGTHEPADLQARFELLGRVWLLIGAGAVLFRTLQLMATKDPMTGAVWFTKILTDPVHDIHLYYRAPLQVFRGELIDPQFAAGRASGA
jgi:hypothetical protein